MAAIIPLFNLDLSIQAAYSFTQTAMMLVHNSIEIDSRSYIPNLFYPYMICINTDQPPFNPSCEWLYCGTIACLLRTVKLSVHALVGKLPFSPNILLNTISDNYCILYLVLIIGFMIIDMRIL